VYRYLKEKIKEVCLFVWTDLVGILENLQLHLRLDDPELGNLRVEEAPVRLELGDAVERGTAGHLPGI
jgi:hypothetical protein